MTRGRTALVGSGFTPSTTSSSSRSRSAPIISGRPPPPPWPRWRLGWRCPRQKIRKALGCGTTDNGAATLGCARTAARRRHTRRRRGRRSACACSATRCGRGTRAGRAQPPPQCENVSRATFVFVLEGQPPPGGFPQRISLWFFTGKLCSIGSLGHTGSLARSPTQHLTRGFFAQRICPHRCANQKLSGSTALMRKAHSSS